MNIESFAVWILWQWSALRHNTFNANIVSSTVILTVIWIYVGLWVRSLISSQALASMNSIFLCIPAFLGTLIITARFLAERGDEVLEALIFVVISIPVVALWLPLVLARCLKLLPILTIRCLLVLLRVILDISFVVVLVAISPGFVLSITGYAISLPSYRTRKPICESTCKSQSSALCDTCSTMIHSTPLLTGTSQIFTETRVSRTHHTPRGLLRSAETCHLCHFLLRSIGPERTFQLSPRPRRDYGTMNHVTGAGDENLTIKISKDVKLGCRSTLSLQISSDKFPEAKTLSIERVSKGADHLECKSSCTTDSAIAISRVKGWLNSCSRHKLCREFFPPYDYSFWPRRLVRIDPRDPTQVYLVYTPRERLSLKDDYLRYAALSHCWGNSKIPTLDVENLISLYKEIPFDLLPRNFQHAIRITAGLGISYLWIDSLCIIQHGDNMQDWNFESTNMGRIYANATCTISATASSNSEGGCFFSRERFTTDCVLGNGLLSSLVVRSWARDEGALEQMFQSKVESAPLTQRGWAFQERALSRRVIHFGDGVILFECITMRATDYHPRGILHTKPMDPFDFSKTLLSSWSLGRNIIEKLAGSFPISWVIWPDKYEYDYQYEWRLVPSNARFVLIPPITRLWRSSYEIEATVKTQIRKRTQQVSNDLSLPQLWRPTDVQSYSHMRETFQIAARKPRYGKGQDNMLEFHNVWYQLVNWYSSRQLTKHTDRLIAILGISYFIQAHAKIRFVAGLWSVSLPVNLLWVCEKPNRSRPARQVPTWSWASVDGKIINRVTSNEFTSHELSTARVLVDWRDYESLETDNGMISNAILLLSGYILDIDSLEVNVAPDIHSDRSNIVEKDGLLTLPILEIGRGDKEKQIHGIVLRLHSKGSGFVRVGYFWGYKRKFPPDVITTDRSRFRSLYLY